MNLSLLIFTFFIVIVNGSYVTRFKYKITDKDFRCTEENANNIKWAIANELNISMNSVEVTCNNLKTS
jgi:uncharacterized protein (UPF0333 family)